MNKRGEKKHFCPIYSVYSTLANERLSVPRRRVCRYDTGVAARGDSFQLIAVANISVSRERVFVAVSGGSLWSLLLGLIFITLGGFPQKGIPSFRRRRKNICCNRNVQLRAVIISRKSGVHTVDCLKWNVQRDALCRVHTFEFFRVWSMTNYTVRCTYGYNTVKVIIVDK